MTIPLDFKTLAVIDWSKFAPVPERVAFWVLIISLSGVCGGVYAFVKGLKSQRLLRLIENIPTSLIRSIAPGLVEVKGQAEPFGFPLKAPFSEEACVYYQIRVYAQDDRGLKLVLKEQSHDRFYLRDETGKMLVSPVGAELVIEHVYTYSDADGMAFLAERKLDALGLKGLSGRRADMMIKETVLSVDSEIYVLGTAQFLRNEQPSLDPSANFIIKKGIDESFFLISDRSEKELCLRNRFWIFAGVFGGPFLATAGMSTLVYLFLYRRDLLSVIFN